MAKPDPESQNLFAEPLAGVTVLTAEDISTMAQNRRLISDEFDGASLQATSYDFRIGARGLVGGDTNETDLKSGKLVIQPGSYAGVISLEKVKLPSNVFALIGSKRKFSYDGLILLTGSVIDPGYEGHLLFGLYNASSKRVVLPMRTKICNATFIRLPKDAKPVPADPYLIEGNFPPDFLQKMANVEVLPWAEVTDKVRRIQELAQAVLELRAQYNDVLEPIKSLTKNVDKVNSDVALLAEQIKNVGGQVTRLEQLTERNADQVRQVTESVKLLRDETGEQKKEVRDITKKVGLYGILVYVPWAVALLALGAVITFFITKALNSTTQQSGPPPSKSAPAKP
jgi:dCTP deaminase